MRRQRMNSDGMPNRDMYMGSTPSKDSSVGLQVQQQMRQSGDLVGEGADRMVFGPDGNWYPIGQTDMGHVQAAVDYWNTIGRYYGPRSPEVRAFMNDSSNYWLEPSSINRSNGASMGKTYLPPATPSEQTQFFGIDQIE
ncbi:MAG TPA: GH-E family nuclease [Trinickia sp.]|nr:GH-E family nuclease [Trinickia sp.]HVW50493.1 GH-E family nuclease [Trinickia sp.]